jgi:DMSO/TMAO reductase YedYZ heme-binding membrane subunit
VATTRSRPPRGREQARHASGGAVAEHAAKIYGVAIGGAVVIVAVLALTSAGHVIDAAVQHFMLYYAGVFTLIALCASVCLGFVATDRMVLSPGHRVLVQSAHRAVSFGALAFLIVHIVTEILAQRVHVLDAVIPFLSPFRTFYIGLGTIASDLIILLVITSIYRKRFTTNGKAWRWRAIHYCAYASFVFGVWHGLLGGRAGKAYVDWSYGLVIASVALGLGIRVLANSLRPKENLSSPPVSEASSSGSAPMRAAAMFAQLGIVRAASSVGSTSILMPGGGAGTRAALPAAGGRTGPMPAITALPAPVLSDAAWSDTGGRDTAWADTGRQPVYEPGYDGPPRYTGAPRNSGTGPMPRAATGPLPRAAASGSLPRAASGPLPRADSGPLPRAASGPLPRVPSGPLPRVPSGPLPRGASGPLPGAASGSLPRVPAGPYPAAGGPSGPGRSSGPRPQAGPRSRPQTGPMPRPQTGPMPRPQTGPLPRATTPPWDSGLPMGDPELRYRDPGPGMPGYRGGEARGGSVYDDAPYSADPYSGDRYPSGSYNAGPYPDGPYPDGPYPDGPYPDGPYPDGAYAGDRYAASRAPADQRAASHYPGDSYGSAQQPPPHRQPVPYPAARQSGQYPGDPYSADPDATDPQFPAVQYPTAPYPAGQYPADPYWDGRR